MLEHTSRLAPLVGAEIGIVKDARAARRKRAAITPERVIEAHLVKRVAALGGHAYKWVSPGRVGVPDRIVMLPAVPRATTDKYAAAPAARPPRLIFVELKATGKKPEPHQLREHERLRALGQTVLVIDSIVQIEEYFQ